jgi:hypothetical protein
MLTQNTFRSVGAAIVCLALGTAPGPARADVPTGTPAFSDPLDIDNPYHPFRAHRIRRYEQIRGGGNLHVIDVFLPDTRTFTFGGTDVECRVLQEWEIDAGEIIEISLNFFAQADDGTVYYFGETVDTYEGGEVVGHDGSWLVGGPDAGDPADTVTADEPTVFMPADPEVGDRWKAEDLPEAGIEEFDRVLRILRRFAVPKGTFRNVLKVEERTPDVGFKWYAPRVGFVQQQGGNEVVALTHLIDSDDAEEREEQLEEILEELLGDDDCDEDDDECDDD